MQTPAFLKRNSTCLAKTIISILWSTSQPKDVKPKGSTRQWKPQHSQKLSIHETSRAYPGKGAPRPSTPPLYKGCTQGRRVPPALWRSGATVAGFKSQCDDTHNFIYSFYKKYIFLRFSVDTGASWGWKWPPYGQMSEPRMGSLSSTFISPLETQS